MVDIPVRQPACEYSSVMLARSVSRDLFPFKRFAVAARFGVRLNSKSDRVLAVHAESLRQALSQPDRLQILGAAKVQAEFLSYKNISGSSKPRYFRSFPIDYANLAENALI